MAGSDPTAASGAGSAELGGAGGDLPRPGGGQSFRAIATGAGPGAIDGQPRGRRQRRPARYRAARADQEAWARATRPKRCKLAANPALAGIVAEKLQRRWSPQQIAGWLKLTYPNDPEMQVSHESIYRTLFVQSRGALRKELTRYLRTGRVIRRPQGSGCPTAAAAGPESCTSPNDQPRQRTGRCPGTGKATWSSAST